MSSDNLDLHKDGKDNRYPRGTPRPRGLSRHPRRLLDRYGRQVSAPRTYRVRRISLSPFSFSLVGVGLPTAPVVYPPPPPARMYISMNPGVRTGRGFGRVPVQLRPGASPPSWTCRSTRYHQRLRLKISRRNVVRRSGSAGQMSRSGAASFPAIRCSTIRFFMPNSWSESALAKDQLSPLVDAGVRGFKCFMIESGVEVCIVGTRKGLSTQNVGRTGIPMCLRERFATRHVRTQGMGGSRSPRTNLG
jgi:hypothetical protein